MRKPPTPTVVTLTVFTTITVVLWIFISVYNILIKKADVEVPEKLIAPLDTTMDVDTLQKLSEKTFIEEGQEKPFSIEPQFQAPQPQASRSGQ